MEKEFIPYGEALQLKSLGFDKKCFGYYDNTGKLFFNTNGQPVGKDWVWKGNELLPTNMILAPIFSQGFKFFRDKYELISEIIWMSALPTHNTFSGKIKSVEKTETMLEYNTYEEAELACIRKLIEISKTN